MQLYEGDQVEVLRRLGPGNDGEQYCECRFENLIGIFPLRALNLKAKKILSNNSMLGGVPTDREA